MEKHWYKIIIDGVKETRLLNQSQIRLLIRDHIVTAYCRADETRTGYLSMVSSTGRR